MLLNEILDKSHPNIKSSSIPMSRFRDLEYYTPNKWNDIGVGQQSKVFAYDKHPGKVVKITMALNGKEDPAYQFLRVCLSHQNNPFFPKIYNVKQYPSGDELKLIISMEKLEHLNNQDFEKIQQLMNIPFIPEPEDKQEAVTGGMHHSFTKPGVRKHIINNTKNPHLKQALRLLEPLFQHYGPDMHLGNIMKRGSQFVFIDPITYEIYDD